MSELNLSVGDITDHGSVAKANAAVVAPSRAIAVQVGNTTMYIEPAGELSEPDNGAIRVVAGFDTAQAFTHAADVLRECVHVIGERLESLGDRIQPDEVTVEFSLTFKATSKQNLIPVLVTAAQSFDTGLKVTTKWKRPIERATHGSGEQTKADKRSGEP